MSPSKYEEGDLLFTPRREIKTLPKGGKMSNRRGKVITCTLLLLVLLLSFTQLSAEDRASGYAVYGPITINTMTSDCSEYRVIYHPLAPTPDPLNIVEGGMGYAWFRFEGLCDDQWIPVNTSQVVALDQQGNPINAEWVNFPYSIPDDFNSGINAKVSIDDPGVFCLKIPSNEIGSGRPGNQETISIVSVNNIVLSQHNTQAITCKIVSMEYKAKWGYRDYGHLGIGGDIGIEKATGFVGGGSGATIELKVGGTHNNPTVDSLTIVRRSDVLAGAEADIGLNKLIGINEPTSNVGFELEAKVSIPYENTYKFDINSMTDSEAAAALYLYDERLIFSQSSQITASFVNWQKIALELELNNILEQFHESDETGMDLKTEAAANASASIIGNNEINMTFGIGFGVNTHIGSSLRKYNDNRTQKRCYADGGFDAEVNLGPRILSTSNQSSKNVNLFSFKGSETPSKYCNGYDFKSTYDADGLLESYCLSSSTEFSVGSNNYYDLAGQSQRYVTNLQCDHPSVISTLEIASPIANMLRYIGSAPVAIIMDNVTMKNECEEFLEQTCNRQKWGYSDLVKMSCDIVDYTESEAEIEVTIPMNVPLVVDLGHKQTKEYEFKMLDGHYVKGKPYYHQEAYAPTALLWDIEDVINLLWEKIYPNGNVSDSGDDIIQASTSTSGMTSSFLWRPFSSRSGDSSNVILNGIGSNILIYDDSIPSVADSVSYHFWTWGDETSRGYLEGAGCNQRIIENNNTFRSIRENINGLQYGIGGFHRFGCVEDSWNNDPVLTIKYLDSEIQGFDESTLAMYWEDNNGSWHMVNSICVPDSNLVRAAIPYFSTYTLAPRLPQGSIDLTAYPDSLLADGLSTTQVVSSYLYNNDGTLVPDGSLFTVSASRGLILDTDADLTSAGIQIQSSSGILAFTVQADSVALPININVRSTTGFSSGDLVLDLYSITPPSQPTLLSIHPEHRALRVTWQEVSDPGVVGYKIYYDVDASGAPYNGTSNVSGLNSPVFVGNTDNYTLTGLYNNDIYYVAVAAVDAYGLESIVSNEMQAQPVLRAVQSLNLEPIATGMKITWQPSFGAENYKIYRADDPNVPIDEMTLIGQTNSLLWIDTSVQSHYQGFYVVVAEGY